MKRSAKQESKCRRMEFKCRLYDVIKDLERSLEPEPSRHGQFQGEFGGQQGFKTMGNKAKSKFPPNTEYCCPPGCCKKSLELRLPKLASADRDGTRPVSPPITSASVPGLPAREDVMGHLPWHEDDHRTGCWPRHVEQRTGGPGGVCYYCCDTSPAQAQGSDYNPRTHRLPNTTEEMQQMGCFFARAA